MGASALPVIAGVLCACIAFLWTLSCRAQKPDTDGEIGQSLPITEKHPMSGLHFKLAAFVHWGTSETEPEMTIDPHYQSMPMGRLQTSPLVRQRIRPLLLRLDTNGGFHVWNAKDASNGT